MKKKMVKLVYMELLKYRTKLSKKVNYYK